MPKYGSVNKGDAKKSAPVGKKGTLRKGKSAKKARGRKRAFAVNVAEANTKRVPVRLAEGRGR